MALDKLTLLDETIINNTATSVATTVVNNSAQTNYISFPVATASPTSNGWRVYKDTDTVAPTVGTGGSPNTTLTQNTDTPLNSTGDFRLTKTSSASRRGEGISTDFTIASRHLAKVLQISFDYELISGTLATDDIRVYIIANPSVTINQGVTNIVIEPVNVSIQGSLVSSPTIKLRHLATFQTHISVTSYRLCIHVASTSTSAYTVDFNNFKVWEPNQSIGAIITDWQSYTPTFTNMGSVTGITLRWRRVGANCEIEGQFQTGTMTTSTPYFTLPNLFIIANLTTNTTVHEQIGSCTRNNNTEGNVLAIIGRQGESVVYINGYYGYSGGSYGNMLQKISGVNLIASNEIQSIRLNVPIAGWGSSVAMSSDSGDGRVVACKYTGMTNVSVTASTIPFKWTTRAIDTHNSYDPSTGRFTAPINGIYRVSLTCSFDLTAGSIYIFKNGNIDTYIIQISSSTYVQGGSAIISLNAGDYIDVRQTNGTYTSYANSYVHISIDRISAGSQIIASSETVACWVFASSNTASASTSAPFILQAKQYDTHGIYSTSTGKFTIPFAGKYNFSGNIVMTGLTQLYAYRSTNGGSPSNYAYITRADNNSGDTTFSVIYDLLAGDTIDFRPHTSVFGNGGTITSNAVSQIFCERIGI